eukprot:5824568-Pyramimonas_sp.AAC.1
MEGSGVWSKQVSGLGCPLWDDAVEDGSIRAYVMCTDAGGDIRASRKLISAQIADVENAVLFDIDCLMHQYHLSIHTLLVAAELVLRVLPANADGKRVKYFTSIQKVMNCWRDNAAAVYWTWQYVNKVEAHTHARNMPPRCMPSRWGSKDECEKKLLNLPRENFIKVFVHVVSKQAKQAMKKDDGDLAAALGAIMDLDLVNPEGLREETIHSMKMSRWCKDSVEALVSKSWWVVMRAMHDISDPWNHFRRYLQSHENKIAEAEFAVGTLAHL